ncbi:MAG: hypothetical protein HN742_13385 [Lentisphaerae bacterium]|nr:hypothetical protein [Lentisphaerota bacterium]MBT4820884.1 hypothetical protein [Lentisphaerota bacterium]MBT5608207.1 hypothetical protein [Lentisphaerota bacterium]MBT7058904.1 hypothetical protein [Lentisphaerota bacterium]MBT7842865.1 hypothetical protein [Lentisphaerota bacterium]
MTRVGLALWLLVLALCVRGWGGERWNHEVAVVDYYAKYTWKPPDKTGRRVVKACFDAVQALGLKPEWVDPDIFLPSRIAESRQFKRIVIPPHAEWFSQTMHEGMNDYVLSGGLLITNASCVLLDANDNYMVDPDDRMTDYPRKHFLGVLGHSGASIERLKVLHACPLTNGVSLGEWLDFERPPSGRKTKTTGATVVITSTFVAREHRGEQPLLTFKHSGRGACVYLVPPIAADAGPPFPRLVENLFSGAVLEWLCLQE